MFFPFLPGGSGGGGGGGSIWDFAVSPLNQNRNFTFSVTRVHLVMKCYSGLKYKQKNPLYLGLKYMQISTTFALFNATIFTIPFI